MIRFLFRVLATLTLAAAVILAVIDATRSVAGAKLVLTPMMASWAATFPQGLASFQTFVETKLAGWLWDPVATSILEQPGCLVLAAIAFLLYIAAGRARPPGAGI